MLGITRTLNRLRGWYRSRYPLERGSLKPVLVGVVPQMSLRGRILPNPRLNMKLTSHK